MEEKTEASVEFLYNSKNGSCQITMGLNPGSDGDVALTQAAVVLCGLLLAKHRDEEQADALIKFVRQVKAFMDTAKVTRTEMKSVDAEA